MDQGTINRVADTAVWLKNRLAALGTDDELAGDWVMHAMPAIVTWEASRPPWQLQDPDPDDAGEPGGPPGPRLLASLLQAQEAGRLGGMTDLGSIEPGIIRRLAAGPSEGTDMRLVTLPAAGIATRPPEHEVFRLIRTNVPEAGAIHPPEYAGRASDGAPVYLVTYELTGSRTDTAGKES